MDNLSVRSERNDHNLVVKPNHMHLLDKPNGYASAMVKSSLSHQMRFTVQKLETELCTTGDPHVLQIKLSGDDSRKPSSWKLFADGTCVANGSDNFARECFREGAVGVARRLIKIDFEPRCRITQRGTPVAAHVHNRSVKRLQISPVSRKGRKVDTFCLALGQKLSVVRPAPADHLGRVATDPIVKPFDHHVEWIGRGGIHGRYPRELADGIRNAFGIFRLHKLRELAHHVAAVIELDGADLDNLVAQPAALALLWHRRKLKVEHYLARKVCRIDSRGTRRLFVWHGQGLSPSTAARYTGGYIAVRISARRGHPTPLRKAALWAGLIAVIIEHIFVFLAVL